jgi:hypothetical protein
VAATLEVDRSHEIDLVEFVGGQRLRARIFLAWQHGRQTHARYRQAVALEHALDGPWAGQRADAEGFEFG